MDCEILRILYLRANGEIPCNCAAGETLNLGWLGTGEGWDVDQHFANPRYEKMRSAFAKGELPWGEVCERCVFLRKGEPYRGGPINKRLEKIQIEPSLACALRCPGCSRIHQAKVRTGPMFLRLDAYARFLTQLRDRGYSVGFFYFCGQGEPLCHPEIERVLSLTREILPTVPRIVNTNGNYGFAATLGRECPERLIVSVDGARQESYEQYRINGDIQQALDFMRDAKRLRPQTIVEWKYILFTYNDSDAEIAEAQRLAEDLGIDALQFVLTHSQERSVRYTAENLDELPLLSPLAYIEVTPYLYNKRKYLRPLAITDSRQRPDFTGANKLWCVLDEVWILGHQFGLKGWSHVLDRVPLKQITVLVDGQVLGTAACGTPRPDVLEALPQVGHYRSGFRFSSHLPALGDRTLVELQLELQDGQRHELVVPFAPAT